MGFDRENRYESVYSRKVKAGKRRTYFFDVRQTKGSDYFVTITESTKKFEDDGYVRHKIFLYKEDFNRFLENLNDVIDHVKNDLMPEYDYDEYARRYDEEENAEGGPFNESDNSFKASSTNEEEGDAESW